MPRLPFHKGEKKEKQDPLSLRIFRLRLFKTSILISHFHSVRLAKVKGRLKLCSGSLIFDPEDTRLPITKLPFRTTQYIDYWMEARTSGTGLSPMDVFVVKASSIVEMKENNINAPYKNRQVCSLLDDWWSFFSFMSCS